MSWIPGPDVSTAVTDGTRGEIYDRYGRALAYNEYTWSLYYDSSTQTEDLNALCHKIAKVLEDNDVKTVLDFAIGYSESRGFYYYSEYQDSADTASAFPGGHVQQIQYAADNGGEAYHSRRGLSLYAG